MHRKRENEACGHTATTATLASPSVEGESFITPIRLSSNGMMREEESAKKLNALTTGLKAEKGRQREKRGKLGKGGKQGK